MIYQVQLFISGDIYINGEYNFQARKELKLNHRFQSDVRIINDETGLKIYCTVNTESKDAANQVALTFVGRMLDYLSLQVDSPLYVSTKPTFFRSHGNVKVLVKEKEFIRGFEIIRAMNFDDNVYLRSLNWYRKGQYSEEPIDKYLAFWNSIEATSSKYFSEQGEGSKDHIMFAFIYVWGDDSKQWPIVKGDTRWIPNGNDIRVKIAHGTAAIEPEFIESVIRKLSEVQEVAKLFLDAFAKKRLFYEELY